MANNQSTTKIRRKRKLVIAIVLLLLLASLFLFKSPLEDESLENEEGITDIVPNDEEKDKEENVVQENNDASDKTNKNENSSLNSSIDNSAGSNIQNNSSNNDNSTSGSQHGDDQIGSVQTPEQPNIQEDDQNNSILKFLYDELIKANNTFQYLLELTDEILENY